MKTPANYAIDDILKVGIGELKIGNTPETLKKVGSVQGMNIIFDEAKPVHCTLIRRKGNKPIAGRAFELGICTKDEALLRIKAYFISEGLFGELDEEAFVYFTKLSQGDVTESKKFSGFIEQFDRLFRCII